MQRLEEVGGLGPLPRPDVPTACAVLGRVPKAVNWPVQVAGKQRRRDPTISSDVTGGLPR